MAEEIYEDLPVQFASDLHLEHYDSSVINDHFFAQAIHPNSSSILCLLGDIGNPFEPIYEKFIEWCSRQFWKTLIITGNHEYYGNNIEDVDLKIDELCKTYQNVYFLNNRTYVYCKQTVFIGTTLWSFIPEQNKEKVTECLNDYRYIFTKNRLLTTDDVNKMHMQNVIFLEEQIKKYKDYGYKIIVLTHHSPYPQYTSKKIYETQTTNVAFSSDQSNLFPYVDVWAYGHTHYNRPGNQLHIHPYNTIFVSNQAGYVNNICKYYNPSFLLNI